MQRRPWTAYFSIMICFAFFVSTLLTRTALIAVRLCGFDLELRCVTARWGCFAVCGQRPKGAALWNLAAFEKAGETFIAGLLLICSNS